VGSVVGKVALEEFFSPSSSVFPCQYYPIKVPPGTADAVVVQTGTEKKNIPPWLFILKYSYHLGDEL
jgi:hypothetical protein